MRCYMYVYLYIRGARGIHPGGERPAPLQVQGTPNCRLRARPAAVRNSAYAAAVSGLVVVILETTRVFISCVSRFGRVE